MKSIAAFLRELPYATAKMVAGEEHVVAHVGSVEHGMQRVPEGMRSANRVELDLVRASGKLALRLRFGLSGEWFSPYFRMDQVEDLASLLGEAIDLARDVPRPL